MVANESWLYAQQSILGAALIDSQCVPMIMAGTTETDFQGGCLSVYQVIKKLFLSGTAVDPVSVVGMLGSSYRKYLVQLMEITPTAANVEHYIQVCRKESRIARLRALGQELSSAEDLDAQRKVLEEANGVLADRAKVEHATMAESMKRFYDRHSGEKPKYLEWPIETLNRNLYAEPGDFIIIGAEPSVGKTAWALQCAWHFAKKHRVGFFSLETSTEKLFDRLMSSVMELDMSDLKRNNLYHEEWDRIVSRTQGVLDRKLELIGASGWTAAEIQAQTMVRGYEIIFVDYLQLVQGEGRERHSVVTNVSMALHTMAQSMKVVIVALSQLTVDNDKSGAPALDSLRESKQIANDADAVMMLSLVDRNERSGPRELTIRKNKEGRLGQFRLYFDGARQTFSRNPPEGRKKTKKELAAEPVAGQITILPDNTEVPF